MAETLDIENLKTTVAKDNVLVKKSYYIKVAKDRSAIDFSGTVAFVDMGKLGGVRRLMDALLNPRSYVEETGPERIEELIAKIEDFAAETAAYDKSVYKVSAGGWDYYVNEYIAEKNAFYVQHFDDGSVQYDKIMMVSDTPINKTASILSGIQVVPPRPKS